MTSQRMVLSRRKALLAATALTLALTGCKTGAVPAVPAPVPADPAALSVASTLNEVVQAVAAAAEKLGIGAQVMAQVSDISGKLTSVANTLMTAASGTDWKSYVPGALNLIGSLASLLPGGQLVEAIIGVTPEIIQLAGLAASALGAAHLGRVALSPPQAHLVLRQIARAR